MCVLLEYVRRSENSPIIFLIFSSRACVIFLGGVGIFIQRRAVNPNRHFWKSPSRQSVRQSKVKSQLSKVTTKKNFQKSQQQRAQKTLSILSVLKDELLDDQRRLSRFARKKKKKKRRRKRRCVTNTTSARRKDADEATKGEEEEEEEEVPREC